MSLSCCQDFSPMYNLNSVRMIILMLYISILFIATKYIYINSAAHMSLSWCQGFLSMYCFLNYPIHEYHLNFSLSSFNRAYISQSSIQVDVKSNMEWTPHKDVQKQTSLGGTIGAANCIFLPGKLLSCDKSKWFDTITRRVHFDIV